MREGWYLLTSVTTAQFWMVLVKKTSCLWSNTVTANLSWLILGNSHRKYTGTCTEPQPDPNKGKTSFTTKFRQTSKWSIMSNTK